MFLIKFMDVSHIGFSFCVCSKIMNIVDTKKEEKSLPFFRRLRIAVIVLRPFIETVLLALQARPCLAFKVY